MSKSVVSKVWSALYTHTDGSVGSAPSPPPPTGASFPLTAAIANGGNSSGQQWLPPTPYSSQVTGKIMSSGGYFQESTFSTCLAWAGRFDYWILGDNWEQADSGSTYDRGLMVDAAQQVMNVAGFTPCHVWQYDIYEGVFLTAVQPYNSFFPTVDSKKWLLYAAANQSGSPVPDQYGGGEYSTNWAVAYPGTVNGVAADQQISPGRTTATYDGNPEDLMQYSAAYFIELHIARHTAFTGSVCGTIAASGYTDSRWYPTLSSGSNNDANKAPNLAGFFEDNLYLYPQTSGFYDLANNYPQYVTNSPVIPWFARGAQHFHNRTQLILAECYPSRTYQRAGNIAHFPYVYLANTSTFTTLLAGLYGYLDGGLIEEMIVSGSGFDNGYGTAASIAAVQAIVNFASGPKAIIVHGVPTSSTDYATGRYTLGVALMARALTCLSIAGNYQIQAAMYLDEFGGNPGTNVPKNWLGAPVGSPPTAAAVSGVWITEYANGVALLNPTGNGSKTITLAQINSYLGRTGTLSYIQGVQAPTINPGGTFSSATIAARDGLLLLK